MGRNDDKPPNAVIRLLAEALMRKQKKADKQKAAKQRAAVAKAAQRKKKGK